MADVQEALSAQQIAELAQRDGQAVFLVPYRYQRGHNVAHGAGDNETSEGILRAAIEESDVIIREHNKAIEENEAIIREHDKAIKELRGRPRPFMGQDGHHQQCHS
ncbi:hypothetical protein CYMTET_12602 [Cymbomonas tetramitiformis]|uniref:Uncharacterized protein n=1 Tax=Cymbomonas tetramitiformis TaxID=36881 RepID=A0AAE0GJS4_9CHLO|nr:hypothetical protein CYMTET_12602 [Cymbomonas tetramitiformis]